MSNTIIVVYSELALEEDWLAQVKILKDSGIKRLPKLHNKFQNKELSTKSSFLEASFIKSKKGTTMNICTRPYTDM